MLGGGGLIKFSVSWTPSGVATPKKEKKKKADEKLEGGDTPAGDETTQTL